jgi:ABC-type nitrate/sulfonate/bicarbonate transport system substrate-binding protein
MPRGLLPWILIWGVLGGWLGACAASTPRPSAPAASNVPASSPASADATAGSPTSAAGPAAPAGPTPVPLKVRLAYVTQGPNSLPVWLAQDNGLYAKYGLDVETTFIPGSSQIAGALVAGQIDVAATAAEAAIGPGINGSDTVMIASWTGKTGFALLSQPVIQSVAELRDKRIGVTRRGSNSELWANAILSAAGFELDRDYTLLSVGGQFEQIAALQNGAIDAGVIGTPANIRARQQGFRELISVQEGMLDFADVGLIITRRYLREQPDGVERLLRASIESVALLLDQPEHAVAALRRYTEVGDRAILDETLAIHRLRVNRDLVPTPAGLQLVMDEVARANPRAASVNPEEFVELGPLRQLIASGFVDAQRR